MCVIESHALQLLSGHDYNPHEFDRNNKNRCTCMHTYTHTQIIEGETRRERDKRRGGGGGEEEETRYNMTISTCLPTFTCTRRQNERIL